MSTINQTDKTSTISGNGEYLRRISSFRSWIKSGENEYTPEKDRYHLYVSLACPWAHRTLIVRKLKGLEDGISCTVVDWMNGDNGWSFNENVPKCSKEPVYGCKYLRDVYKNAEPDYEGRITVPILFDKKTKSIVNNESSEIIRMLTKEFNEFCETEEQKKLDLYPDSLQRQIDEVNSWIYPFIMNGVYRAGFARSQEAYDTALETLLSKSRYLVGNTLTEADVRLFTTLIRFDKVYHQHFKCNKKRIIDYPNTWAYLRELYQIPEFKETIDFDHIVKHYMICHTWINPTGIVAIGPDIDFSEPHGRQAISNAHKK